MSAGVPKKTTVIVLPDRESSLTISSAVWIQLHEHDGRTDRRTPDDSKDSACA